MHNKSISSSLCDVIGKRKARHDVAHIVKHNMSRNIHLCHRYIQQNFIINIFNNNNLCPFLLFPHNFIYMRHIHTQITQVHLCLWTQINIKLSFNGIIGALIINYLLFAVVFYAHVYFMLYCGFFFSSSTLFFFMSFNICETLNFFSFVLLLLSIFFFFSFESHVKHEFFLLLLLR